MSYASVACYFMVFYYSHSPYIFQIFFSFLINVFAYVHACMQAFAGVVIWRHTVATMAQVNGEINPHRKEGRVGCTLTQCG